MSALSGSTPDIICVSTNHWTGLPTSKQHLSWVLSRTGRVLYVDPPIDVFSAIGRRRRWGKFRGLRRVDRSVWVRSPLSIINRSAPSARLEFHRRHASRVQSTARSLGFRDPVLWTFTPEHRPYVGRLGESVAVYHVADDLPAMSRDPETLARLERRHIEAVDLIFFVSKALRSKFVETGKAHRMPNAADARHYGRVLAGRESAKPEEFAGAVLERRRVPAEFRDVDRPILLYGGATYQWFDRELFFELARARPEWTFALVGPPGEGLSGDGLPGNVLSLGRRGYDEFPHYVAACDVAIMPWRDDAITRSADPINLYEYLLCGKPVVATPFPAALEREGLVRIAETADAFESAIGEALKEDPSGPAAMARMEFGLSNTWEDRARRALVLIEECRRSRRDAESD